MKSTLLPFLKQAMKLSTMIVFALITTTGLLIAKKVTAQYLEKRIVMHLNGENAWEVIQQMERQDIRFAYNAETLGLADIKVTNHQARIESSVKELLRSEEHTSELQSLMRISYAVFCLTNNMYSY